MVAVDPAIQLLSKSGERAQAASFKTLTAGSTATTGANTVTGPPGLGFRAAGSKRWAGRQVACDTVAPHRDIGMWGGEGGDAEQCAITDVAINRLRYSGGRGGGAGHAGGGGGSAYRNGNGYPVRTRPPTTVALAAPALAVAVTGIPVSKAALAHTRRRCGRKCSNPSDARIHRQ